MKKQILQECHTATVQYFTDFLSSIFVDCSSGLEQRVRRVRDEGAKHGAHLNQPQQRHAGAVVALGVEVLLVEDRVAELRQPRRHPRTQMGQNVQRVDGHPALEARRARPVKLQDAVAALHPLQYVLARRRDAVDEVQRLRLRSKEYAPVGDVLNRLVEDRTAIDDKVWSIRDNKDKISMIKPSWRNCEQKRFSGSGQGSVLQ